MMPKSYLVFKWTVYSLATLALFALQYLVLDNIQVLGLTPFLYPVLPAVAASYEGLRRGSVFALAVGLVCDLLLPGPIPCFYTLVFPAAALCAALISRSLLPAGLLCAAAAALPAFLLTDLFHCLLLWGRGQAAWAAGAWGCQAG